MKTNKNTTAAQKEIAQNEMKNLKGGCSTKNPFRKGKLGYALFGDSNGNGGIFDFSK